jgi:hypothetical protein
METPKQKSKELVDNYLMIVGGYWNGTAQAKQCALIAVDEIIKSNPLEPTYIYNDGEIKYELHSQHYWKQVKTEIETEIEKL